MSCKQHTPSKGYTVYVYPNLKSKAAIKRALADGVEVTAHHVGFYSGKEVTDGEHAVEGPHYPEPHRWYGTVTLKDGVVTSIK